MPAFWAPRPRDQPRSVHRPPCPAGVIATNGPAKAEQKVNTDLGFFVQDTWTLND